MSLQICPYRKIKLHSFLRGAKVFLRLHPSAMRREHSLVPPLDLRLGMTNLFNLGEGSSSAQKVVNASQARPTATIYETNCRPGEENMDKGL